MSPNDIFLQLIVPVMACIIIFIVILTCLCKTTNRLLLQNTYGEDIARSLDEEGIRRSLEMIQHVEHELNIINEQLEIVSTLKDYLHNLHNPQIIEDENIIIIVGPDNQTMHLGTKIVD